MGGMLHALNHSLIKGALFLVSGNIIARYASRSTKMALGLRRTLPFSSILWLGGFMAISGMPPFGMFFSKFLIIQAAFVQGRWEIAVPFLLFLMMIFAGMCIIVLNMYHGDASVEAREPPSLDGGIFRGERLMSILPPACLLLLALALGLHVPGFLMDRMAAIGDMLGVK